MTAKPGQFTVLQLLGFMRDAANRILESTAPISKTEFMADTPAGCQVRDAAIYNIGVLGEAANDLAAHYPAFAAAHLDLQSACADPAVPCDPSRR